MNRKLTTTMTVFRLNKIPNLEHEAHSFLIRLKK